MKKLFLNMFMVLLMLFLSNVLYAQYQGPGVSDKIYSVKEIKDNASRLDRADSMVKLKGFVIKQINSDVYLFKDETGTINVEIEKESMPAKPFNDKTELILIGEVDYDFLEGVEIEVNQILFAKS